MRISWIFPDSYKFMGPLSCTPTYLFYSLGSVTYLFYLFLFPSIKEIRKEKSLLLITVSILKIIVNMIMFWYILNRFNFNFNLFLYLQTFNARAIKGCIFIRNTIIYNYKPIAPTTIQIKATNLSSSLFFDNSNLSSLMYY